MTINKKFLYMVFTLMNILSVTLKADVLSPLTKALSVVGKTSQTTGPNCWNYALYGVGLVNSLRNVEADEFSFFINSKFCQKIQPSSPIVAGQIGAIQDLLQNEKVQNHAFLFLTSNDVLTKNGPYSSAIYQRMPIQDLFQIPSYQLNEQRIMERYHCESLDQFIAAHPGLNIHLLQIYQTIKEFEAYYQKVTFEKIELDLNFKDLTLMYIEKAILDMAFDGLKNDDRLFKEAIAFHLKGLSGQIYYSHASPIMDQFEKLSKKLRSL